MKVYGRSKVTQTLFLSLPPSPQDMEKHGYLLQCFQELRQMLQTPIKPYDSADGHPKKLGGAKKPEPTEGTGSDDEEEGSPTSSQQHSSSDGGSDLEDLLTKDFPQDDLPSLMTRAMGKGVWYKGGKRGVVRNEGGVVVGMKGCGYSLGGNENWCVCVCETHPGCTV